MIRQESYFVYKVWIILVTQIKNYIFWVYKNYYPDYYYKDLYAKGLPSSVPASFQINSNYHRK